jgi:uncharacterized repeat protein (TIGR04138 family)
VGRSRAPDWEAVRQRAAQFPPTAFQFVRDGLGYTVRRIHGEGGVSGTRVPAGAATGQTETEPRTRHVTGTQLCLGLREFAYAQYGALAGTVLRRWGIESTEDFGAIVYAMIEQGEMRAGPEDSFDDFCGVYEFDEAFGIQV